MSYVVEVASGEVNIIEVGSGEIEWLEVGAQGPPGIQGDAGFTTGIDIISGGLPDTDFTNEYQFSGGAP